MTRGASSVKVPVLKFLIATVSASLLGATLLVASDARQDENRRPFKHTAHVHDSWYGNRPEVRRDCRGCHQYESEADPSPQELCNNCHYRGNLVFGTEMDPKDKVDMSRLHAVVDMAGFEHFDHLAMECRECHQDGRAPQERYPIPQGVDTCKDCHGDAGRGAADIATIADESFGPETQWRQAGFIEGLNASPGMGPSESVTFLHSDHMADPAAADGESCLVCHRPVWSAGATDLHQHEYETASCGDCHQGAGNVALDMPARSTTATSLAALTFAHSDHSVAGFELRGEAAAPSNEQGYADIEAQGCLSCHSYGVSGDITTFQVGDATGGTQPWSFEGCIVCHDRDEWASAVDFHTQEEGWDDCRACHEFGAGDMAEVRAEASVTRRRPTGFDILSQTHPLITGTEVDQDCADCHKAAIDELPSRIGTRAFQHSTHLPLLVGGNETDILERCDVCHASRIDKSDSSESIGFLDGIADITAESHPDTAGLTYDVDACNQCHLGEDVVAIVPAFDAFEPKIVTSFPHDLHLGSSYEFNGGPITCLTCHVGTGPSASFADGDVGTLPAAMDCTMCHQHDGDAGIEGVTGDANRLQVDSCAQCHGREVPGIDAALEVQRAIVASIEGAQVHPADQACSDCHFATETTAFEAGGPSVWSQGTELQDNGKPRIHSLEYEAAYPGGRPKGLESCSDCHWGSSASNSIGDYRSDTFTTELANDLETTGEEGHPYPGRDKRIGN